MPLIEIAPHTSIYHNIHKDIVCNQNARRSHAQIRKSTAKKVTKPKYCRLLSIIGQNRYPMSKYEIERAFTKEFDPSQKSKKVMSIE